MSVDDGSKRSTDRRLPAAARCASYAPLARVRPPARAWRRHCISALRCSPHRAVSSIRRPLRVFFQCNLVARGLVFTRDFRNGDDKAQRQSDRMHALNRRRTQARMNMGTGAARRESAETPQPPRASKLQLGLPLNIDAHDEDALRAAWKRSGLSLPYHVALRIPPLAICIRCLADAMRKKARTGGAGATDEQGSDRRKANEHSWAIRSRTRRYMQ